MGIPSSCSLEVKVCLSATVSHGLRTHGHTSDDRLTKSNIHQVCMDTWYRLEDLQRVMADRDWLQKGIKGIRTIEMSLWWWWEVNLNYTYIFIYIYIYVLLILVFFIMIASNYNTLTNTLFGLPFSLLEWTYCKERLENISAKMSWGKQQRWKYLSNFKYIYIYIYIYIHIVTHRQTVSLYHNFSVWLDTLDAWIWDQNPPNFTLDLVSYCSANKRTTSAREL